MTKAIYFDMDGTIYDLYTVENWLDKLDNEDVTAYTCGAALVDMIALNSLMCAAKVEFGLTIGVITWSSKNGSKDFNKATRKAKQDWIKKNFPCVDEFHCVQYGTNKHSVAKIKDAILVDDNAQVRNSWNGVTIDATKNIIAEIQQILIDMM